MACSKHACGRALDPLVAVACRLCRNRPAVQHLLWAVVLLKFVTPPVVCSPGSRRTFRCSVEDDPGSARECRSRHVGDRRRIRASTENSVGASHSNASGHLRSLRRPSHPRPPSKPDSFQNTKSSGEPSSRPWPERGCSDSTISAAGRFAASVVTPSSFDSEGSTESAYE